jgi:hypothetical protein
MIEGWIKSFRVGIAVLSAVLMLFSCWLLVIELLRPRIHPRLDDPESGQVSGKYWDTGGIVARIGLVRGRLWTEDALTFAPFSMDGRDKSLSQESIIQLERAREAATRAVHSAPLDARAWLVIAQADSALGDRDPAAALKMSYYVSPNADSLFLIRLAIATRSNALTDPELPSLLGDEIHTILPGRPDFKPDIVAAYRDATSEGKRFIEQEIGRSDRDLLPALRSDTTR